MFGVLRRNEILALLVDWGYRSDGIPVRLFDAWTTLPAGPATLAAKTGALDRCRSPSGGRRRTFRVTSATPITVPSSRPADIQRATQAIADALAATIAAAPEQWYSFKPMWPATAEGPAALAARAGALAGPPADRREDPREPRSSGARRPGRRPAGSPDRGRGGVGRRAILPRAAAARRSAELRRRGSGIASPLIAGGVPGAT